MTSFTRGCIASIAHPPTCRTVAPRLCPRTYTPAICSQISCLSPIPFPCGGRRLNRQSLASYQPTVVLGGGSRLGRECAGKGAREPPSRSQTRNFKVPNVSPERHLEPAGVYITAIVVNVIAGPQKPAGARLCCPMSRAVRAEIAHRCAALATGAAKSDACVAFESTGSTRAARSGRSRWRWPRVRLTLFELWLLVFKWPLAT